MAATGLAGSLGAVFEQVRDAVGGADGELLARYRTLRDEDAFGSLVRRHGPMVLGVCRRVLRDAHAADDAFQVTFLVLARKADAVRPPDRLAPWLYGVAYRTALKARGRAARRQQVEGEYASQSPTTATQTGEATDLPAVLDEQVNALPEKYRVPLVLCGVQGLNKAEAATRLGVPEGTVSSRLARARDMLRDRLSRRGVVVPAAGGFAVLAAEELSAAVPPTLTSTTIQLAVRGGAIPPAIQTLSHEVIRSMSTLKLNVLGPIALGVTLVGGGFGLLATQADEKKPAAPDAVKQAAKPDGEKPAAPKDGQKPAGPKDGDKPEDDKPAAPKDGDKPKKTPKFAGKVSAVDASAKTITLVTKGEAGNEIVVKLTDYAKVTIDGKDAKVGDIAKGATATFTLVAAKDGQPRTANEVVVSGLSFGGSIKRIDGDGVTVGNEKFDRVLKLAAGGKVLVDGKDAKLADLKVGDRVTVTLTADDSAAVLIAVGGQKRDGDKPRPEKAKPEGDK
ncbi:sigma-70 family RNA polymerase sigma factor [Gemmata sp.]|uniref:RNA polymerase sigma factor n=1 Tax=Gemmata sp. TaxID=1914242 RepID=UPI003F716054